MFGVDSKFGWSDKRTSNAIIKDLVQRYYAVHPSGSNWAGGGFYWEFAVEIVPYDPASSLLWKTINTAMANQE